MTTSSEQKSTDVRTNNAELDRMIAMSEQELIMSVFTSIADKYPHHILGVSQDPNGLLWLESIDLVTYAARREQSPLPRELTYSEWLERMKIFNNRFVKSQKPIPKE
jgi:hypothetical protein